ncbi:hypothetical protein [Roseibium aggregatum]|uniref:hypothetical protein n=1 Tax=Roseibium aggregatum TaxID=187304 RepID=UPI003A984D2C
MADLFKLCRSLLLSQPAKAAQCGSIGSSDPPAPAARSIRSVRQQENQGEQRKNDAAETEAKCQLLPTGSFPVPDPFPQDGQVPVSIVVKAVIDHPHYLAKLPLGSLRYRPHRSVNAQVASLFPQGTSSRGNRLPEDDRPDIRRSQKETPFI